MVNCYAQVSHNWGNLFANLVAAVVADAMDLASYKETVFIFT